MGVSAPGPIEVGLMLFMFFFGSGSGIEPFSPLPEDQKLMVTAPAEPIAYYQWNGSGPIDSKSTNSTQKFFSDPEIERFMDKFAGFMDAIVTASPDSKLGVELGNDPETHPLNQALFQSFEYLYKHSWNFALLNEKSDNDLPLSGQFVLSVNGEYLSFTGKKRDSKKTIESIFAEFIKLENPDFQLRQTATGYILTTGVGFEFESKFVGNYLVFTTAKKAADSIENALTDQAAKQPAWLSELSEQHKLERRGTLGFLNAPVLFKTIDQHSKEHPEFEWDQVYPYLKLFGISEISGMGFSTGLDEKGYSRSFSLDVDHKQFPFSHIYGDGEGFKQGDLSTVPADASLVILQDFEIENLWAELNELGRQNKDIARIADSVSKGAESLRLDLEKDIFAAIGNKWIVTASAEEGPFLFNSLVASIDIEDEAKFKTLLGLFTKVMVNPGADVKLLETEYHGNTIFTAFYQGNDVNLVAPSWAVANGRLFFGLYPQAIKHALQTKPGNSFTGFNDLLAQGTVRTGYYSDPVPLMKMVFPFVSFYSGIVDLFASQYGLDFHAVDFPSTTAITKHMSPKTSVIYQTEDGFMSRSHDSMIISMDPMSSFGFSAALLLPAIQQARAAAVSAQQMNNMRQVMLAFFIHEDTHREFPSNIQDKNGKPLLSWRVKLLPYIDQQGIYDQIKLDEPWDSQHNKQFHDLMPQLYASRTPGFSTSKTTMLGLAGKGTWLDVIEKKGKLTFTDLRNSFNAACVVEVADSKAVNWMKPDDFTFDPKNPATGLREGDAAIGFMDGHVEMHRDTAPIQDLGSKFKIQVPK